MRPILSATTLLLLASIAALAVEIPVIADAHVSSVTPQLNAGSLPTLNLNAGTRIYLRFPLSSQIPAGTVATQIATAWLHLWVDRSDAGGTFLVQPAAASWDEATITFANAPALSGLSVPGSSAAAGSTVRLDITSLVRLAVTNGNSDLNLAIVPDVGSPIAVYFDSKENTATSHASVVEIEVAGPITPGSKGPTGFNGLAGATGPAGAAGFQTAAPSQTQLKCSEGSGCTGTATCLSGEVISGGCSSAALHLAFTGPVNGTWSCIYSGTWHTGLEVPQIYAICAK